MFEALREALWALVGCDQALGHRLGCAWEDCELEIELELELELELVFVLVLVLEVPDLSLRHRHWGSKTAC